MKSFWFFVVCFLPVFSSGGLDWQKFQQGRFTQVAVPESASPGFQKMAPSRTGLEFTNVLAQSRGTTNQIYFNGSGVTAGDVDRDGWCDLFFSGLSGSSRLYRNLGDWHFKDITAESGIHLETIDATGAVLADVNGDGKLDLLVTSIGAGTHLFLNDGAGHFRETMREAGLSSTSGGMSMALGDIDQDGALDLYIANYRPTTLRDQPRTNFRVNMVNGRPVIAQVNGVSADSPSLRGRFSISDKGKVLEHGELDTLFRNDGTGKFSLVPFAGGSFSDQAGQPTALPYDWGLSVMFRDLNGDGRPDLYVCNDFDSPDRIWINQGSARFQELPENALRSTSKYSMGVDVADIDRDGYDDIFVLDMLSRDHVTGLTRADRAADNANLPDPRARRQVMRNSLQLNRQDGSYSEIALLAGLEASDWSWCPIFLDVDLDGYEDLLITTGHARDDMHKDFGGRIESTRRNGKLTVEEELKLREGTPPLLRGLVAFRNQRDLTFSDQSTAWHFDEIGIHHGMCLADLDNDGDLDVIVNRLNGPAGLYQNQSSAPRVAVRLKGIKNTAGIGARIELLDGAVPRQSEEVISGGRYLSSDEASRVFAAGTNAEMKLVVHWPGGKVSWVDGVRPNRIYEINETSASKEDPSPRVAQPLFEDISSRLGHSHYEESFDDFQRQPLLPRKLSQDGPGVTCADIDGDGWDDIIIGGGRGSLPGYFLNDQNGGFKTSPNANRTLAADQTSILPFQTALLVGNSNYEETQSSDGALFAMNWGQNYAEPIISVPGGSVGPLALADLDGDGRLELFVAGACLPGRYPLAGASKIYRNQNGSWQEHPASEALRNVGLVTSAIWTDLNGDGFPELVMACEWSALRVFQNTKGQLVDKTIEWGFQKYSGLWQSVAIGDFDSDGRLDILASNWGRNSKYQAHLKPGVRLYYNSRTNELAGALLETYRDEASGKYVPFLPLDLVAFSFPFVKERFTSYQKFAESGVEEILGVELSNLQKAGITWLDHTVFLNRGSSFEAVSLPILAQVAPSMGCAVADFDGDGSQDIFLSQNFYPVHPETGRYDAGQGLLLKGDGRGRFTAMTSRESGIKMSGEMRGTAVADFDRDGRPDLVVSQNNTETKLYHNTAAPPGLRVKLRGPVSNPQGVGAIIRVKSTSGLSAAQEICCGSGRYSCDSAVLIFTGHEPPSELTVLWPGGSVKQTLLSSNLKEVEVDQSGNIVSRK
jgi:hypothetical protein